MAGFVGARSAGSIARIWRLLLRSLGPKRSCCRGGSELLRRHRQSIRVRRRAGGHLRGRRVLRRG
ncbi:MAG: hypothetical protein ACYTEV_10195 [Planctomycetota bacterium]